MKRTLTLLLPLLLGACGDNDSQTSSDESNTSDAAILAALEFPDVHAPVSPGVLRPAEDGTFYNPEAVVPPQCYTRHEGQYNPCMTCHQSYPYGDRPNTINDGASASAGVRSLIYDQRVPGTYMVRPALQGSSLTERQRIVAYIYPDTSDSKPIFRQWL